MGHRCLIEGELRAGRLVAPFDRPVATGRALVMRLRQPVRAPLARLAAALRESRL